MNKDSNQEKDFLKEQLEWTKEQIQILDKIDNKLHEMKAIAVYVTEHSLIHEETKKFQAQLLELQNDVKLLEKQLYYNQLPN
ncbi:hypothetical protein [Metabacillus malikii]|uniref:Uncharacterized protein n=1 Tax=Metabacillus malikii TaxID=1504265 RepID=A0ABT9ZGQ3_9BACI|nr:hypothetical protein [Metabacillus malikii]MDQ0231462.1 hypothetical protein [Metabacillus malikii]